MDHKFKHYGQNELIGLSAQQLEHLALIDEALSLERFAGFDVDELERMSPQELRSLIHGKPFAPLPKIKLVKQPERPSAPLIERIEPSTLDEAFALRGERVMRRLIYRHTFAGVATDRIEFAPLGERVRFANKTYRVEHIRHWLTTGQWPGRKTRAKTTRYRGRLRIDGALVHLGYFATADERSQAVALAKLGIYPNGAKKT